MQTTYLNLSCIKMDHQHQLSIVDWSLDPISFSQPDWTSAKIFLAWRQVKRMLQQSSQSTYLRGRYSSVTYWKPKEERACISAFTFVLTWSRAKGIINVSRDESNINQVVFDIRTIHTIIWSSFIHSGFFMMKASWSNSLPVLISFSVIFKRHCSGRSYLRINVG